MVHLGTKGIDKQLGFKIFVAHNPNFSQIKQQDKELNPSGKILRFMSKITVAG